MLSVITIKGSKNVLIFNFSILFDGKVNLVGALGRQKFPIDFKSAGKNKRKLKEDENFYAKSVFDIIDFGLWCN